MLSKLFKSNFWKTSSKKLKPIGKDIFGNIYYEDVVRTVKGPNNDSVRLVTVPKENSDWLTYKTDEFPLVEKVKKGRVYPDLNILKRRIQNEAEMYEIVMYLNKKVKKSTIAYTPCKELTLFVHLNKA